MDECLLAGLCLGIRGAVGSTYNFAAPVYRRLMRHWATILPAGAVLDIDYEDLVADVETAARRMVEFIGLPWDPACLEFHRRGRTILTFSQWQVRQRLHRASVERWRHYEAHIGPLLALTARAATER